MKDLDMKIQSLGTPYITTGGCDGLNRVRTKDFEIGSAASCYGFKGFANAYVGNALGSGYIIAVRKDDSIACMSYSGATGSKAKICKAMGGVNSTGCLNVIAAQNCYTLPGY
ncbi:MAG: hypothetical protein LBI01_06780 [Elusimicrobium sp.]|jgi:hypothetical protein|nr:hypothetical protein [Elusimicrobium sp.]